ncbi:MAG: adenine deaminase [Chrysothrix sp. TS-e1954]|nr:MAG: adenine deaminase [Chrysothrix sp. TS-e1954]
MLFSIARRNNVTLPESDPAYSTEQGLFARYEQFSSLDDFLKYYYIGLTVLIKAVDFEDLAWSYFLQAHADGVMHSELFFDPQAHTTRGISLSVVIQGLKKACERAQHELGMSTELISCFLRHLPISNALELYDSSEFQAIIKDGVIRGIGLDSSEDNFPPELFSDVYDRARGDNLRLTAHAGEEGPPQNIAGALSRLGCERIDHGIKLAQDAELMKRVADKGVLLTVCPLSNVFLKAVGEISELPIHAFLDAGVRFSINSDDPAYFGGFILANYCAVQEAFNLTVAQWATICEWSIQGSWCNLERKTEMRNMLQQVIGDAFASA